MHIDNPEHKKFLLEMFDQMNFPGKLLDMAHEVKRAVAGAQVGEENKKEKA